MSGVGIRKMIQKWYRKWVFKRNFSFEISKKSESRVVHFILICVVLGLAGWLRLYNLADRPPVLNPDEASIAYNALLLAKTGLDEWQEPYPLILRAFGDQKIGGYTYLVVVQFLLFGISEWSVRFPAAFAGLGVVALSGWFFYKLLSSKKEAGSIALITMALLAIQPVFIWYSRSAFEATVSLFLLLITIVVAFVFGVNREEQNVLQSYARTALLLTILAASMAGAIYLYNAPLVWIPFLFLPIPVWYGITRWKSWLPIVLTGALVWGVSVMLLSNLTTQKSKITLFGDPHIIYEQQQYYLQFESQAQRTLLGNQYVFYGRRMAQHFFESLSPSFVVRNLDGHPWHVYPRTGYLTAPIYWLGWVGLFASCVTIYKSLLKRKRIVAVFAQSKTQLLMAYLTVTSLIPALITVNAPHATRTLFFFLGWTYFAAYGVRYIAHVAKVCIQWSMPARAYLVERYKKLSIRTLVYSMFVGLLAAVIAVPSANYAYKVIVAPYQFSDWGGGVRAGFPQMLEQIEQKYSSDTRVTIVDPQGFLYIAIAWYQRLEPTVFWENVHREPPDTINFTYGSRMGRYDFVTSYEATKDTVPLVYWDDAGWTLKE